MKEEAIMFLETAIYINSLPPTTQFWVYFIMFISIPLLLFIDNKVDNMQNCVEICKIM